MGVNLGEVVGGGKMGLGLRLNPNPDEDEDDPLVGMGSEKVELEGVEEVEEE
ncbi:hypothetical protein HDU97_008944, partial [Phlyctochytrium planicorne]